MTRSSFFVVLLASVTAVVPAAFAEPAQTGEVARGYELLADGHRLDALKHFEQRLASRPDDLALSFGSLVARHIRLQVDDSEQTVFEQRIDRLITLASTRYTRNNKDDEALFYLAQAHMLRGGYRFEYDKGMWGAVRDGAAAKKYSETYIRRHPEHGDAYLALGIYNYYVSLAPSVFRAVGWLFFLPSGNRTLGLQQIERAASSGHWFAPRARLLLMEIYGTLEQRPSDALAIGRSLEARHPYNDHVAFALADVYLGPALEDRSRAAAVLETLIDRAGNGTDVDTVGLRLRATIALASVRQEQWRVDEAIGVLTPVIQSGVKRPSWALPQALLARGNYRALVNDARAAEDARLVASTPAWAKWHDAAKDQLEWIQERSSSGEAALYASLIPGNRLTAEKRWEAAERAYEEARERHRNDPQVRYRLAYLTFARGDSDAAASEMSTLASAGKGVPDWLKAGALLTIARSHDLAGRREQARRTYQTILDRYEKQYAARAARLGLITPYARPA
jgi:tetratricopeptide (TPR) repeat protein